MLTELELTELENEFISSIVFDPECIMDVFEILDANDLNNQHNIQIYAKAINLISQNKKYDMLEIMDLVSKDAREHISTLQDGFLTSAKVVSVAKKLREYADAKNTRMKVSAVLHEPATAKEFVEKFERITFDLAQQNNGFTLVDIFKTGDEIVEKSKTMGDIEGYSWGLPKLDRATGGIIPGKTYVIGGSKKTGKTKFIINTIHSLWNKEVKSLFISLEMNNISVIRWIVARFSDRNISTDDYRFKNQLNVGLFEKLLDDVCSNELIYIDTRPGLSFLQIKNQVWRNINKGVKVVFIDYLQRMVIDNNTDNRATAIQKTVGYLADMAKDYNIALIILSQLANIAEGKMGQIQHLKESGGIAENVDCIMILNNIDRVENNLQADSKKHQVFISIDQRDGESQMIKCFTRLQFNEFAELSDK